MPLTEALDEEIGVGFNPNIRDRPAILKDLIFASDRAKDDGKTLREHGYLAKLVHFAYTEDLWDIDLTTLQDSHKPQRSRHETYPPFACVHYAVHASSAVDIDSGRYLLQWLGLAGPSAGALLGRFCHLSDEIEAFSRESCRLEQACHEPALVAEIAHLPQDRLGNITTRPTLRDAEIPYLAAPSADASIVISATSIQVTVSDGEILLYSPQLQKRVIPRLSNAHNTSAPTNLGLYQFLAALQHHGYTYPHFSWGEFGALPALPRIRIGRVVVSPQCWNLSEGEISVLSQSEQDMERAISRLRRHRKLPRFVTCASGDNVLLVDLENMLSVISFVRMVKNWKVVCVQESIGMEMGACLADGNGAHSVEIMVPLCKKAGNTAAKMRIEMDSPPSLTPMIVHHAGQIYPPGSEWLYAKIYSGEHTAEDVLLDCLMPVLHELVGSAVIDKWFFVRYRDPEFHIRLRMHGDECELFREAWPIIQATLETHIKTRQISQVRLDTYQPEYFRYHGSEVCKLSEVLFHQDSVAVGTVLADVRDDDLQRFFATAAGIDGILNMFHCACDRKVQIATSLSESFFFEYQDATELKKGVGDKFRAHRDELSRALSSERWPAFGWRAERSSFIVEDLMSRYRGATRDRALNWLIASYIHMHANRMFRNSHREQELVLYEMLKRIYMMQGKSSSAHAISAMKGS